MLWFSEIFEPGQGAQGEARDPAFGLYLRSNPCLLKAEAPHPKGCPGAPDKIAEKTAQGRIT
jgi:hypothetical protein